MGKRFKSALVVAGCITVILAAAGPLLSVFFEPHFGPLIISSWAAGFGVWLLATVCSLVIYFGLRIIRLLSTLRKDIAAKNNRDVIAEVRDTRVKQSRHEFKQELLLDRIETTASTLLGDIDSLRADEVVPALSKIPWHGGEPDGPKILFITSNGSGMGHLSRCLAAADEAEKVGCRTGILTLSTAYEVVRASGYPVMYHPSSAASPWSISVWNRSFARFLQKRLNDDQPDVVVFDGTAVYRGVTQVCRRLEIPLVWLRRGMWKDKVSRIQYDRPLDVADYVIVPGEVTGEAPHDQEGVYYTDPLSQASQMTILAAAQAKRALGLEQDAQYALVQVGSAKLNDKSAVQAIVEYINTLGLELTPVVLVSPVAQYEPDIPGALVVHGRYPLAPYLKAFEFAVCSAGYNSVHENLAARLPAVYLPNTATLTDDQTARAQLVAQAGMGLVASSEAELQNELRRIADTEKLTSIRNALNANSPANGGNAIIDKLLEIIEETRIEDLHPSGEDRPAIDR